MRVYISVDMEGISGVTRWQDVIPSGQDYQRARSWMTQDVNAAIAGARLAGATKFVVEENHGVEMLCNLLLDEIDPEAEVVRGIPRGGITTAAALDESCDAVFLVGHHAKAGDRVGIGAHTISYERYKAVRIDGRVVSEGEIFATIAAQQGVPTALVTGDDVVAAEMVKVCPDIETVVVKHALSRTGGRIVPPRRAQRLIREGAKTAVERLHRNDVATIDVTPPFDVEVELREPLRDDVRASIEANHPEFELRGDRTVGFRRDDMALAYRMAAVVQVLEAEGRVRSY